MAYEVISSNVGRNADELLRRVQASQFVYEHGDQVCPGQVDPPRGDHRAEPRPRRSPLISRLTDGRELSSKQQSCL